MKNVAKTYTTFYIGKICGVYPTTVANWIDDGKLKAFTTPGGHRRVGAKVLKEFLEKYNVPLSDELAFEDRKKVLVVDDDNAVIKVILRILAKDKNYEVHSASDGFQAGNLFGEIKPALVILDIKLPGIDGFEVCRMIRKKNKNVKIIAITGYDSEETRKKIIASGADVYLPKPFKAEELLTKVRALIE